MGKKLPKLNSNWKVVVMALFVATTFWFFNALSKNYDAYVAYPLEFDFQRDSLIVVDPLPEFIKLEVAGVGWDLLRRTTKIGAKPIVITLDNPTEVKLLPKNNLQRIISEQLKDISVKYILTDSLFINIETKISRKIPIAIDSLSIDLEKNHRITSPIRLSQDSITLTGPISIIRKLKIPYSLFVTEKEIDDNFNENINIPLPSKNLTSSSPETINIQFDVEEFKEITMAIPIEKLNFENKPALLRDTVINASFKIALSKEKSISPNDFSITADYTLLNPKDSTISLLFIYTPEGAVDLIFDKEKVKMNYE